MDEGYRRLLEHQQYRIYMDHQAVKPCAWLKESLTGGRHCYKQDFYGIRSHRCLQMAPAFNECTHMCPFCWRVEGRDFEVREWAEPKDMLDNLIARHRVLISGFKGDPRCDPRMFAEAMDPDQVACSLAGEPTEYPYLSEFFRECHSRGMTTFLVTNGTNPDRIASLDVLPRMLYVTVAAPDEQVYRRTCRPKIPDGWQRILETLALFPSLDTRTCIRHTLVNNYNLLSPESYAGIDRRAEPDFIEPKGYVFVGGSRQRLSIDEMPSFTQIREFSMRLAGLTGTSLVRESADSRVCLLTHEGTELDVRRAWEGGRPGTPRTERFHSLPDQRSQTSTAIWSARNT